MKDSSKSVAPVMRYFIIHAEDQPTKPVIMSMDCHNNSSWVLRNPEKHNWSIWAFYHAQLNIWGICGPNFRFFRWNLAKLQLFKRAKFSLAYLAFQSRQIMNYEISHHRSNRFWWIFHQFVSFSFVHLLTQFENFDKKNLVRVPPCVGVFIFTTVPSSALFFEPTSHLKFFWNNIFWRKKTWAFRILSQIFRLRISQWAMTKK